MTKLQVFLASIPVLLASCTGPVIMGTDAAVVYVTRPASPPGPDVQDQIPQHASWCYQTMGDSQCFAHPQNVAPDRLINVDPENLYPVDLAAYHQALLGKPPAPAPQAASTLPVVLPPAEDNMQVERDSLSKELNGPTVTSSP